jgi:hypothetical protein
LVIGYLSLVIVVRPSSRRAVRLRSPQATLKAWRRRDASARCRRDACAPKRAPEVPASAQPPESPLRKQRANQPDVPCRSFPTSTRKRDVRRGRSGTVPVHGRERTAASVGTASKRKHAPAANTQSLMHAFPRIQMRGQSPTAGTVPERPRERGRPARRWCRHPACTWCGRLARTCCGHPGRRRLRRRIHICNGGCSPRMRP